jgi:hypothetical protein
MIDAGNLRHLLNRHFHFAHVGTTKARVHGGKIILDGVANVLHCFLLRFALRPATGKRGAIHRVTLLRLMKHDLISKTHRKTLHRERPKLQRTLCLCDAARRAGLLLITDHESPITALVAPPATRFSSEKAPAKLAGLDRAQV